MKLDLEQVKFVEQMTTYILDTEYESYSEHLDDGKPSQNHIFYNAIQLHKAVEQHKSEIKSHNKVKNSVKRHLNSLKKKNKKKG